MKRITGLDWPLWALAGCLLILSAAGSLTVTHFDDPTAGLLMLLQSAPYAVASWLVLHGSGERAASGRALASILLVGAAMRILLLPGTPVSNDLFRYIWDGRVQAAGISETPIAMKAAMLAFEGVAVWTILQLLALRGLPRTRILLYAWHPLPLWEFARSGHIDIVAIAFLLLAFLAVERRSPILAGLALGAGVLVKYVPVVTAPALYKRWDWRLPAAFAAAITVLYLPYIGVGTKVFGFLGSYISEEGLDRGAGIFPWQLAQAIVPMPQQAFAFYPAAAAAIMAALALLVVMRAREAHADLAGGMMLAVAFTLLVSPHYAWYFAWLVPFVCFYPVVGVIYLTCACGYLYFAHWPPTVWNGVPIYGPCIFLLVAEFALRQRRKTEEPDADAVAV